jgi:uncharacterized repeat protein (TIGR01451 family)
MNTIIHKFSAPRRGVAKGFHFMALFGAFTVGAFSFIALHGGLVPSVSIAHAQSPTNCVLSGNISGSVSNTAPHVGDTIVYTFGTNTFGGSVPTSTSVTIVMTNDTLPPGLTFISSSTSGGPFSGLWSGGVVNFTITAQVNSTGTIAYAPTFDYGDGSYFTDSMTTQEPSPVTITATLPSAPLVITKTANPTTVVAGSTTTVDYTITVKNNSTSTTSDGVVVKDLLPSGLIFESSTVPSAYNATSGVWTVGNLSAGSTASLSIYAETAQDASSTITNTATVTASTTDSNSSNSAQATISVTQPTSTPTSTPSADISISKAVTPTSTTVGSTTTVDYTITVTNNSSSTTSKGVVVSDVLPSALTFVSSTPTEGSYASSTGLWTIGDVNAGASVTLDLEALVDTSASSTISNTATLSASTTDPNTANNSSTVLFFVNTTSTPTSTPSADLVINKTVDNTNPSAGNTVNYTITVTNNSTSTTSTDVVASDTLPTTLTFDHATASASTSYASSTGTWTIGALAPNATATLQIAAFVNSGDAGDTITNTATVSASTTDPNTNNNSSSISIDVQGGGCGSECGLPNVDLAISKTADVTSTFGGDPINYTIVVTNLSSSTTSTDVVATDTLPSGLTFKSATASASTSYASSTGTWTIGALAPNATATLQIAALVTGPGVSTGGSTASTITNTATVGESPTLNDPDLGNNSSSVSVLIGPAPTPTEYDLAISKTVDNASPTAGDDVNYTIVVTNKGSATSTFVDAQDLLPTALSIVSSTISQGSTTNTGVFDWDIGTLAPNATATLVLETLVGSDQAGQSISNTATVSSSLSSWIDSDLSNNSSTATINVQGGGGGCTSNCGGGGGSVFTDMSITKAVDNSNPATGATINYTLTVKDAGQNPTLAVVADDILPAGLTFVSATSSLGSYASSTGVWKIGALNAGQAVTLTITATVTASGGTAITNTATVSQTPTIMDPVAGNNSSSVTITVAGGGGGQVLGASTSTGQVLGASCGLYLTSYIHPNRQNLNDPVQVKKLQTFLNQNLGIDLPVTGYYGSSTIAAVDQFQVKYHNEVLSPWVSLGLPTQYTPTNYVYQSTQRWINLIMCPSLNLPLPALKVDNSE